MTDENPRPSYKWISEATADQIKEKARAFREMIRSQPPVERATR